MAQVSVGDHVSALDGSHDGTLVDVDGSTGYVVQNNGVEIEYPLSRLKPYEPPKVKEQRTLSGPLRDRVLDPEQKALLASVPASILDAVAKSYAGGEGAPVFAALPPSKKLEVIRIHLPTLPQRLLAPHMKLVLAMRQKAKPR